jgi:hypothetical protein
MDTNGNGMIDADEVTGGQKLLLERMIVPTGMELKYPLVIDQVRQSVMKSYQSLVPTGNSGPTGGVSPRGETAAKAAPWPAGSALASPPVAVPAASSPIGSATVGPRAEPSLDAAGTTTARPSRATPASATTSPSAPLRKSGRFLRPIERLPKGLPDWFTARDADGDGQVSMAEFTTDWTPAKVAEFARYDPNGDGVIASAECLKVEKRSQRP